MAARPTKQTRMPARAAVKRGTLDQRQRALELAVQVSGVSFTSSYANGGAYPPLMQGERRKTHEDTKTILETAAAFLSFMAA